MDSCEFIQSQFLFCFCIHIVVLPLLCSDLFLVYFHITFIPFHSVSQGENSLILLVFTDRVRFPFSIFVFEHAYPELRSGFQIKPSESFNSYASASQSLLKIIILILGLHLSSLQLHQIANLQSSSGHLLCSILLCHF